MEFCKFRIRIPVDYIRSVNADGQTIFIPDVSLIAPSIVKFYLLDFTHRVWCSRNGRLKRNRHNSYITSPSL